MKSRTTLFNTIIYTSASVIAKLGGFVVQIILGWVLIKEEYGLFAIALSISAVFSCLRNGGTDQVIIQRGDEYESLAPQIASLSIVFNVVICMLILGFSEEISNFYDEPELAPLLFVLAIGYLFATPGPILIAKLAIQNKFKEIAFINLITVLAKHGLTIALAIIGFGVFSLLVPLAIQPVIGAVIAFQFVKSWPGFKVPGSFELKKLLSSSIWVVLSNLGFQLSNNIQYFILARYLDSATIGSYFFAVQIINSPISLINNTVKGVVFPVLSNINEDKKRYKASVIKSIMISFSIGCIIGLVGYIVFPKIVGFVWKGKWDVSIVYVKLLCFLVPITILMNTIYEILASAGLWKDRFILLILAVLVDVLAIFFTINEYLLITVVGNIVLWRLFFTFISCFYLLRRVCGKFQIVDIVLMFVSFYLIALFVLFSESWEGFENNRDELLGLFVLGVLYYILIFNRCVPVHKIILNYFNRFL